MNSIKTINEQDKLSKIITKNYNLLPIINRFGIRLGFNDQTIEYICREKSIPTDFFLTILNVCNNDKYFPKEQLLSYSPILLIDYLRKTHQYYLNYILPKTDLLLEKLIESTKNESKELILIHSFYQKYKSELLLHIQEEEEKVFPYILSLIETNHKQPTKNKKKIETIEKEHSNVDNQIKDLINLIIRHIKPTYDDNTCNEFLASLFQFECDIKYHARIEENILLVQVKNIHSHK